MRIWFPRSLPITRWKKRAEPSTPVAIPSSPVAATAPFIAILADWRSSRLEYICQSPVEIGVRRNALRAIVGA